MRYCHCAGHGRSDREDQGDDRLRRARTGSRLPREADLGERLGLSRNSLREAVEALSLIRVPNVRQGDGTYVTSLDPVLLLDVVSFAVDFHRDDTVLLMERGGGAMMSLLHLPLTWEVQA